MPSTTARLIASQTIAAAATAYYTAGILSQVVRLSVSNPSASPVVVTLYLVPSGGSAGASTQLSKKTLNVNETWTPAEWAGPVLNVGDAIYAQAGTASAAVITAAGTQTS